MDPYSKYILVQDHIRVRIKIWKTNFNPLNKAIVKVWQQKITIWLSPVLAIKRNVNSQLNYNRKWPAIWIISDIWKTGSNERYKKILVSTRYLRQSWEKYKSNLRYKQGERNFIYTWSTTFHFQGRFFIKCSIHLFVFFIFPRHERMVSWNFKLK